MKIGGKFRPGMTYFVRDISLGQTVLGIILPVFLMFPAYLHHYLQNYARDLNGASLLVFRLMNC